MDHTGPPRGEEDVLQAVYCLRYIGVRDANYLHHVSFSTYKNINRTVHPTPSNRLRHHECGVDNCRNHHFIVHHYPSKNDTGA